MRRKPVLFTLLLAFAFLITSCGRVASPADVVKPPQTGPQDNLMDKYRELKGKNASPAEIINFSKENIGNLEKEDADIVMKGLIEAQRLKLENYRDKLLSPDFNAKINKYGLGELKAPDGIEDEEIRTYLQDAFNDGFKLFEAEGMKDLEIDYENTNNNFSGYLSGELAAYIAILSETSRQHSYADGAIIITYDELADRIIGVENFIKNYPDSGYRKEMEDLHSQYLTGYLIGLNNTPAFDADTLELKRELLKSFETAKARYADSALAATITGYMELLGKNNNKRTREVLQYVGKITGNPEFGSAD